MTKYCKDCKYSNHIRSYWCEHPNVGISEVDGIFEAVHCKTARFSASLCGAVGEWFDPKPSRLAKLLAFFQPAPKV